MNINPYVHCTGSFFEAFFKGLTPWKFDLCPARAHHIVLEMVRGLFMLLPTFSIFVILCLSSLHDVETIDFKKILYITKPPVKGVWVPFLYKMLRLTPFYDSLQNAVPKRSWEMHNLINKKS